MVAERRVGMSKAKILKASYLGVIPVFTLGLYWVVNPRTAGWVGIGLSLIGLSLGWAFVARFWLWLRGDDA